MGKFCVPQRQEKAAAGVQNTPQTQQNGNTNNTSSNGVPNNKESQPLPQNDKRPNSNHPKKGQHLHKNEQPKSTSLPLQTTSFSLPAIAAYQRHELTLLRMEDLLNNGSGSQDALPSK